jgi:hypothetical protein
MVQRTPQEALTTPSVAPLTLQNNLAQRIHHTLQPHPIATVHPTLQHKPTHRVLLARQHKRTTLIPHTPLMAKPTDLALRAL